MRIGETIQKAGAILGRMSHWGAVIAAALLGFTILQIVVAVIMRRVLGIPVAPSVELGGYALVLVMYMAITEAFVREELPVVTLLFDRLSRRTQALFRAITLSVSLVTLLFLLWKSILLTKTTHAEGAKSLILRMPEWVLLGLVCAGMLLLSAQVVVSICHQLVALKSPKG